MPSDSLTKWKSQRSLSLEEIENALTRIYGLKAGRRPIKSQSLNFSYLLLLSSEFQGFCRDIHTEASLHVARNVSSSLSKLVENLFSKHRKLDAGNPNPGSLGDDFGRFGFDFWPTMRLRTKWNENRRKALEDMNDWGNAIAHQKFDPIKFGMQPVLYLDWIKRWRKACNELADEIDDVLQKQLTEITGKNA